MGAKAKKTAVAAPIAAAIFAAGYVAGGYEPGPHIEATRGVNGMRQLVRGEPACTDLGIFAGETYATGESSACYQINGHVIPAGNPLCAKVDELAATIPLETMGGERGRYKLSRLRVAPVNDQVICAQADAEFRAKGRFVAEE